MFYFHVLAFFYFMRRGIESGARVWWIVSVTVGAVTFGVFFELRQAEWTAWRLWIWVVPVWIAVLLREKAWKSEKKYEAETWECPQCDVRNKNGALFCGNCDFGWFWG